MKIVLVFPPFPHKIFSPNIRTVDEEFIVPPPIVLAYVAAILEKNGHHAYILDSNSLKLSKQETLKKLKEYQPDMIGFRMDTFMFQETLGWIKYFKAHIDVPIIIGGLNLEFYPRESLSHPEIDFGIIGESLYSLPKFLERKENGKDYSNVDGLGYKNNGKLLINMPQQPVCDFNLYPLPARHLLPNKNYYSFVSKRKNFTIMVSSRGCPQDCRFCSIAAIPYRERKASLVLEELKECYEKYHIREIDFFDGDFFINRQRIVDICEGMIHEKLDIEWDARTRVDKVDKQLFQIIKKAGCRQLRYGIESGNDKILNNLNKNISISKIREIVKLTQKHKIEVMGFFMIGNPGETKKDVFETIRFAKKLNLDHVQVGRTTPKSGSILCKKQKKDYWKNYTLGKEKEKMLEPIGTKLSANEVNTLVKKMYTSFYFRPSLIIKTILKVKSFEELKRYIKVGIKILINKISWL